MKIHFLLAASLMSLSALADPSVTLAGLQIVYDSGEKEFDGFKTYNLDVGHSVTLIIRSEDKALIRIDDEDAKVTIGGAEAEASFFSGMGFSEDRKAVKIEFRTEEPVKVSADGSLEVKGTLPIALATGKEGMKSEAFAVKEGEKVPFSKDGLPEMKIKSVGKPSFGDDVLEIEFSTDKKMDDFAGVSFTDKDGKEVKSDRRGSSWMGFGNKGAGSVEYSFEKKHSDLVMVLETWTGLEETELKVDLKATLSAK